MSDRTTKVTLILQASGYISGMDQAAGATKRTAVESQRLAEQQAALRQTTQDAGRALLAFGAIAAAGVVLAVKKFADFDKAMSGVKAATQATTSEMGELRAAAIAAGDGGQFSATQAADAITQLGKAGLSTKDILSGGLSASLNLAASDNLDLATASGIAATAMQQFGLQGKDLGHVSDLLAAGANKALGGVEDLANGLKFVGPVAAGMGVSIDETTAALAAFASQGILGEQAGTGLRGVLSSLTSPSKDAQKELDKLGVTLYDSTGKFLGLRNVAGQLDTAFSGLTDQQRDMSLGMIFGNMQVTAARVLFKQGAEGIAAWTDAVNDQGFAAKIAAQQMDNLQGDLTKLSNTINVGFVQSGTAANDILRNMTQGVTGLVQGFNSAGPVVQGGALALAAVTASAAILGGGLLILLPKIQQTRLAMQAMNITGMSLAKGFGKGGVIFLGLTAAAGAISGMGSMATLAADQIARLDAAVGTGNLDELNKEFVDASGNTSSFKQALDMLFTSNFFMSYQGGPAQINGAIKTLSAGMIDLGAAADTDRAKFDRLGEALGGLAKDDLPAATIQFNKFLGMTDGSEESIRQLLSAFPQYKAALIDLAAAQGVTLSEQELFSLAVGKGELATKLAKDAAARNKVELGKMGAAAADATGAVDGLSGALKGFNDTQFTADEAISTFRQSVLDLDTAMGAEGFTGTLDETTQEGIDNNRMLRSIAETANTAAGEVLALTGKQEDANVVLEEGRATLERVGSAFGLSGDALQAFIDKYVASPKELEYKAAVHGIGDMDAELDAFFHRWNGKTIDLRATGSGQLGSGILGRASGGILPGAPSRSDNMLIAAASGEFVTNSTATAKNRQVLEYINKGGVVRGFASGGEVGRPAYAPVPQFAPAQPAYMQASSARGGDVFNIYESIDGRSTALAVQRRQSALGAV